MPAVHIRDVPEETVAAIKRRAAAHGRSVQAELRLVLDRAAQEAVATAGSRGLQLRTVATGRAESFDRDDFYGDDER